MSKSLDLNLAKKHLALAQTYLRRIKDGDIKHREIAKASIKPKWTRSINLTTSTISMISTVKRAAKRIPKRVC